MIVLGIESSCDETAAAVVDSDRTIRSNLVLSQLKNHRPFGGVVPELAARAHLDHLDSLILRSLDEAGVTLNDLSAVAVTGGPGLIGGVMVGVMAAKAIAVARNLPLIAVNHLEGHALSPRLSDNVGYPFLLLLVSGGHCQLLAVEGVGRYCRLGTTIDDAVGECFDKVAKMLGLGYPGGPLVEKAATQAKDPGRFDLPRPMKGRPDCHFSFSGLKTAVRQRLPSRPYGSLDPQDVADMAAAFQQAVSESLVDRCARAMQMFRQMYPQGKTLVVAGGVAANQTVRAALAALAQDRGFEFVAPPLALCGDNAAMIAWAGIERFQAGWTDGLDFAPRPRWPLDPDAPPATGAGVKA
ncbi:MAG: tRNA (adenosine(37)-N6)-threonylcarbamoyltransferase complex transferase subunit TsaD [Pseudomonadota bacterium]|nr:tRNA (adenosine(37)-N6)-threonylcarbamoyltransferase complex transferase subunit TsaD [Pseudomonadota bacterium]